MMRTITQRTVIICSVLFFVAILSIFVVAPKASKPETYKTTIRMLNEKQTKVLEMTATATTASLALGAVPGDATTPIANKIIDMAGYFIIILSVIVLEKYMLTIAGYLTFTWLIPIACALLGIYLVTDRGLFRHLALKTFLLGASIFLIVPASVKVGSVIEKANEVSINTTMDSLKKIEKESGKPGETPAEDGTGQSGAAPDMVESGQAADEEVEAEGLDLLQKIRYEINNLMEEGKQTVSETTSTVTRLTDEAIKNARDTMNDFVEVVVVMLVTTCGIPILTVLLFVWIIKTLLGVDMYQIGRECYYMRPARRRIREERDDLRARRRLRDE